VKEWQALALEEIYTIMYLDVIHFHVWQEGTIIKKEVYIALCITMEGRKDVLGM